MKNPLAAVLGLTAACAACCAVPLALPAILAFAGVTSASVGAGYLAAASGGAALSLLGFLLWQRARRKAVGAGKDGGCSTSCDVKACR